MVKECKSALELSLLQRQRTVHTSVFQVPAAPHHPCVVFISRPCRHRNIHTHGVGTVSPYPVAVSLRSSLAPSYLSISIRPLALHRAQDTLPVSVRSSCAASTRRHVCQPRRPKTCPGPAGQRRPSVRCPPRRLPRERHPDGGQGSDNHFSGCRQDGRLPSQRPRHAAFLLRLTLPAAPPRREPDCVVPVRPGGRPGLHGLPRRRRR
ncbi:hypothetical protein VTK73DRAFT_1386 [Phialemonium thermophilum]|uniref:Uncharacterized protein n=1 Tax=Phialemonium thermophilum TaxID=223376 RepID=A0ABR3VTK2_9PEZI